MVREKAWQALNHDVNHPRKKVQMEEIWQVKFG